MEKKLTKKDIFRSWLMWWFTAEMSHSYERLQGLSFGAGMLGPLQKLYPDYKTNPEQKAAMSAAIKRHLGFFNTEANYGSLVNGVVLSMEEQKANGADIPEDAIIGVKTGLMGPMAGIGDTLDWATVLPILVSLFIPLAASGSWVAGIGPVGLFLIYSLFTGFGMFKMGYNAGTASAENLLRSGKIKVLITGAAIVGLFMMGGLTASYVKVATPLVIATSDGVTLAVQDIINKIIPNLLSLLTVTGVYLYLEKVKRNYLQITLILIAVGLVFGLLGIL